jgi:hypothetical protein
VVPLTLLASASGFNWRALMGRRSCRASGQVSGKDKRAILLRHPGHSLGHSACHKLGRSGTHSTDDPADVSSQNRTRKILLDRCVSTRNRKVVGSNPTSGSISAGQSVTMLALLIAGQRLGRSATRAANPALVIRSGNTTPDPAQPRLTPACGREHSPTRRSASTRPIPAPTTRTSRTSSSISASSTDGRAGRLVGSP